MIVELRRFNQDGMKTSFRQQVVVMATQRHKLTGSPAFDRNRMERQIRRFGGVLGDRAAKMSKLRPQTKALLKEAQSLIKLSRLPPSAASPERPVHSSHLKTWLHTAVTEKRPTRLLSPSPGT